MSAAVQHRFAAALRDPAAAVPADLARSGGRAPEKRFAVYRNNVAVALIGAIEARFPALRRIVGEAFFTGLARAYVAAHPPRSPLMMTYGDDFPAFLAGIEALAAAPYAADVARLEAARTRAYHAADAEPLGAEAFAAIDPADLAGLGLRLHPSLEVVASAHPVVTLWAMNAGEMALAPIDDWSAEDAVVVRPALEVHVRRLPKGGARFLAALAAGATLADAAAAAATVPGFDLTQNLAGLIEAGLAAGFTRPVDPETPR